ncbi:hypothetical protein M0G43_12710 [Subsaxibacter sp. CAU 1640]|uniref:hypothetical protein n=1 Tax=Subsaxibacter sp. CAU 1640 TaxID=2933271 RepID=UPI002002C478|nr:hypothetical protein [Subsaxibacter sp. CAU 1640]MCK7591440.1 hypothetical protein [Subsaxibacter sp. CAU 1640]
MKDVLKSIIRPMFFGFLFYLFILLGYNAHFISKDSIRTWTAIIAGTLFIYLIVYAVIHRKESFEIGALGFYIAHILFSIGMPIFLIINQVLFTDRTKNAPKSLLQKNNMELVSNPIDCNKIKYGKFLYGIDTIIRYSENKVDYELIKTIGYDDQLNRIRWLDSCSYVRVTDKGLVTKFIKLGNIKNGEHQMYEKPGGTHTMSEENIKTVTELKN